MSTPDRDLWTFGHPGAVSCVSFHRPVYVYPPLRKRPLLPFVTATQRGCAAVDSFSSFPFFLSQHTILFQVHTGYLTVSWISQLFLLKIPTSWRRRRRKKKLCFPHRPCLPPVHARRAVWCHNVQVRCIRASHQARIVSKYQLVTMMTDRNKQIAAPFRGKRPVCWE